MRYGPSGRHECVRSAVGIHAEAEARFSVVLGIEQMVDMMKFCHETQLTMVGLTEMLRSHGSDGDSLKRPEGFIKVRQPDE